MTEVEEVDADVVKKGGVLSLLYFDLHGTSKEMLQHLGVSVVHKLLDEQGVVYARGEIEEPIKNKHVYSTTVEVRLLVERPADLVRIVANYSPVAVEVLQPDEIVMPLADFQIMLTDVAAFTFHLRKTMMEKTYTKEDWERVKDMIKYRQKVGEQLLKKGNDG
jgi:hypothetical protein